MVSPHLQSIDGVHGHQVEVCGARQVHWGPLWEEGIKSIGLSLVRVPPTRNGFSGLHNLHIHMSASPA